MIAKYTLFALIAVTAFVSCSESEQNEAPSQTYNKLVIDTAVTKKTTDDAALLKSILQPPVGARNLTGLPENASQNGSNVLPGSNNTSLNPAHGQPGHQCDIAVGAPLNSKPSPINNATQIQSPVTTNQALPLTNATPAVQAVTAGMNPAHGQPNHRCDIAVGAPLNSKPAPKNPISPIVNTQSSPVTGTPAPVQNVAPGMNPAHGQPNHRCDIAVGAPLNSKPATTVKSDSSKK